MQPAGFDGWFTLEYTRQQILSTQANGDGKAIMCGDVWGGTTWPVNSAVFQTRIRPGSDGVLWAGWPRLLCCPSTRSKQDVR